MLLLHPAKDFVVILVDAGATAGVGIAVVVLVGKVVVFHVDVFGLAGVAVAVAYTRLLGGDGGAG